MMLAKKLFLFASAAASCSSNSVLALKMNQAPLASSSFEDEGNPFGDRNAGMKGKVDGSTQTPPDNIDIDDIVDEQEQDVEIDTNDFPSNTQNTKNNRSFLGRVGHAAGAARDFVIWGLIRNLLALAVVFAIVAVGVVALDSEVLGGRITSFVDWIKETAGFTEGETLAPGFNTVSGTTPGTTTTTVAGMSNTGNTVPR